MVTIAAQSSDLNAKISNVSQDVPALVDYLTALGVYGDPLPHDYAVQYRMVLDVDGNGWSSRIHTLLASGALVLRSAVYSSFLDGYLQPYVHYVPVRMDYSDLVSSSAVRRG